MDILICMFLQHIFTMITYSYGYIDVYIFMQHVFTLHATCMHIVYTLYATYIHIVCNMYSHCIHIVYTRKCIPAMCIPVADKMYL